VATLQKTGNEIIKCENLSYWYETYEKKSGINNGDKRYKYINK